MWKIGKRNPKSLNKKTKFLHADYNANYKKRKKEIFGISVCEDMQVEETNSKNGISRRYKD